MTANSLPAFGLALGAGGARGFAHIGVLRSLERRGLRPAGVAGASMGALVGALYALGATPVELTQMRLGERVRSAIRIRISSAGLLDPAPLVALVSELVGKKTFDDASIPLAITAFDLSSGDRVVIRDGPVAPAVVASMMVPAVFPPYPVQDRRLLDPGVIDSVPVDVAATFGIATVLAVSANRVLPCARTSASWCLNMVGSVSAAFGRQGRWPWAVQFGGTLAQMSRGTARYQPPPNIIWIQPAFGSIHANRFGAWERAIHIGEEAAERVLASLASGVSSYEAEIEAEAS